MSYETYQPPLVVFYRNVAHVTPIHDTRREIYQIAGADGEQIG